MQGLTEFLPISSDGHLAVTYALMGIDPNLSFEVFLHAATLIAMLTYFWSDVVRLLSSLLPSNRERTGDRKLVLLIAVATVVSAVVALALERCHRTALQVDDRCVVSDSSVRRLSWSSRNSPTGVLRPSRARSASE